MPRRPPSRHDSEHDTSRDTSTDPHQRRSSVWGRFRFSKPSWLKRDVGTPETANGDLLGRGPLERQSTAEESPADNRRVIPYLPRAITYRRQASERRERLVPLQPCHHERRQLGNRRRALSASPKGIRPMVPFALRSLPDVASLNAALRGGTDDQRVDVRGEQGGDGNGETSPRWGPFRSRASSCAENDQDYDTLSDATNDAALREERESKWILNVTMHFRDRSEREKFFLTFAQERNKWRRVTVSCDYRNAEPGSLEADLRTLHFQRDKSARIYEAIRDSLPDIQFYDTVTNLKLETKDGRLHVHVTEDVNEIIPYPLIAAVQHLEGCPEVPESAINFETHLSGFVYKVSVGRNVYIKKEIPSVDTVDEFLYEVNALFALRNSKHVINFVGVVVDDAATRIKGLLIDFADSGALVDLLFNAKLEPISWSRREKWARQIIQGLADIHEHGFVQGDFTLSNIVVTSTDNAEIIDINRRGCAVGWEPPELKGLIASEQRISMYIGIKTDLFQLGMVLWALAAQSDEPEKEDLVPPFDGEDMEDVPDHFRQILESCLATNATDRKMAKDLLAMFPEPASKRVNGSSMEDLPATKRARHWFEDAPNGADSQATSPERVSRFSHPMHQDSGLGVEHVNESDGDDEMESSAAALNHSRVSRGSAGYNTRSVAPQTRGRTLMNHADLSADLLAGIGAGVDFNVPAELDIGGDEAVPLRVGRDDLDVLAARALARTEPTAGSEDAADPETPRAQ